MGLIKIAIIGRPNVGKSTLFNQITGTRKAVVKDEPGVTRDVHRGKAEWLGVHFDIFDTAGVSEGGDKAWSVGIRNQALKALRDADKVLFVLDGKFGLNPEDKSLWQQIKIQKKPVLAIVNKIDEYEDEDVGLSEFYELDLNNVMAASFEHKHGLDRILDWIIEGQERNTEVLDDGKIRIAIVGKPNAGKSTLVNSILGENRVVVSPVAGTTVDSVEVPFTKNNQEFILIDTAGLRRRARRNDHVELISAFKANESIAEANILLIVVDGLLGPSQQDARIVELALEHHRAVILVINKIDMAESKIPRFRDVSREKIRNQFHFFADIPVCFISAKTGRGVDPLFALVQKIWSQLNKKISTQEINDFFFNVIRQAPSPSFRGRDTKFYYITQTKQRPPSFMAFVNEPRGITKAYRRFLSTQIKKQYDLVGIPIRIYPKKRRSSKGSQSQRQPLDDNQ